MKRGLLHNTDLIRKMACLPQETGGPHTPAPWHRAQMLKVEFSLISNLINCIRVHCNILIISGVPVA